MEFIDLVKALGISSVPTILILMLVVLLGKRFADAVMRASVERHKLDLSKKLESYKAGLLKASVTHQVVLSTLHGKRFDAIMKLWSLLDDFGQAAQHLVSPFSYTGDPDKKELGKTAAEKGNALLGFYYEHRLLFTEETCELVERILGKYRSALRNMSIATNDRGDPHGTHAQQKDRLWVEAEKEVRNETPKLERRLREELRAIMGSERAPE